MPTRLRTLSLDLGASSGRAMLAEFDGSSIRMRELHRFANDPVALHGTLHWDVLRLFHEIKQSISMAVRDGGFDLIGIDTWGVDFGLLGHDGRLLENPVHYRDSRTDRFKELYETVPRREIYASTGIQEMQINTLHQLFSLKRDRPELLARARRLLFMPDLLNYFLTGETHAEYTIASTSELLDARARDWDFGLIDRIGIDRSLFCGVVHPGAGCGTLGKHIQDELGAPPAKVLCVASHDTASAVSVVPSQEKQPTYIISGTWSLLGTELAEPRLGELPMRCNFTNEGGVGRTIRYLKNIMGTWIMQECRRQWQREGKGYSFNDLDRMSEAAAPFARLVDVDAPEFIKPGDMPARVRAYCERTGQPAPADDGEVARCVCEGLALKYRYVVEALERSAGVKAQSINILGGGTKSAQLCQMAADATRRVVSAGPVEATALGSAAVMLVAAGELSGIGEARRLVAETEGIDTYEPCVSHGGDGGWDEAYWRLLETAGLAPPSEL